MMKSMALWARSGLLLLLVTLLPACTTFNRKWDKAAAQNPPKDGIEGRWQGTWLSGKNGHTGFLKCIVTKVDDKNYQFYYKAGFWKIFTGSYKVYMAAEKQADGFRIHGQENLGRLYGGVYTYEGIIKEDDFAATYKCRIDFGTFTMKRME